MQRERRKTCDIENNGDINDTYGKFFRADKKWIIIAPLLIVREFVLLRFSGGSRFEYTPFLVVRYLIGHSLVHLFNISRLIQRVMMPITVPCNCRLNREEGKRFVMKPDTTISDDLQYFLNTVKGRQELIN